MMSSGVRWLCQERSVENLLKHIEVNNEVHHFQTKNIQSLLKFVQLSRVSVQMEEWVYAPDTKFMLHEFKEWEKVFCFCTLQGNMCPIHWSFQCREIHGNSLQWVCNGKCEQVKRIKKLWHLWERKWRLIFGPSASNVQGLLAEERPELWQIWILWQTCWMGY